MIANIICIICLTIIVICSILQWFYTRKARKIRKEINKSINERREKTLEKIRRGMLVKSIATGKIPKNLYEDSDFQRDGFDWDN